MPYYSFDDGTVVERRENRKLLEEAGKGIWGGGQDPRSAPVQLDLKGCPSYLRLLCF